MSKPTKITNEIRRLRFDADEMTQAELAKRIGVTRQTALAIEQGRYSPSLEVAFKIANVFNVPLEQVFQYPEGDD
ncbi:MAG: helix-turn-helix transcriptional regulator [Maricaulis sp.]|uniref:helix-turn-helix transcriptional regulator n=1 Tax=Maricaulis sp. TaxID=1486257 RepID=UPI001B0326C4|nr:helix-turn-helix transcriptional regulator [Maricaulis sp.]MBO6876283.1 helix-turn-helix transcriptional regulator [Maricaulis sp.]